MITEEKFLKDVSKHEMTIYWDDPPYRHIKMQNPDTLHQHFTITTWPGYLCISGDMNNYLFSRLPDMFDFFRDNGKGSLFINPGYWAEKLRAVDCVLGKGDIRVFSEEKFRRAVEEEFEQMTEGWPQAGREELWESIEKQILTCDDNIYDAISAVMEFNEMLVEFSPDFPEWCITEFEPHFIWCLYAIVYTIRCYDTNHTGE